VLTLARLLHAATEELQGAGIEDARLEAEVLLRHTLRLDRAQLYTRLQEDLSPADEAAFRSLLARRVDHEPTAYIVGHREFYGLDFETTPAALIPRPETELVVDEALARARERPARQSGRLLIADVGTGNGAIAVALAARLPGAVVMACDLSREALALAARNARRHGVEGRISFVRADLLPPLTRPADLIVANLPYVRTADWEALPPEIREHEPRLALDGGPDGLREIGRLLEQAPSCLAPGGSLLVEFGPPQAAAAFELARRCCPGACARVLPDAAGLERVLAVDMPPP
jgi:release factor glutamine methyltransferase